MRGCKILIVLAFILCVSVVHAYTEKEFYNVTVHQEGHGPTITFTGQVKSDGYFSKINAEARNGYADSDYVIKKNGVNVANGNLGSGYQAYVTLNESDYSSTFISGDNYTIELTTSDNFPHDDNFPGYDGEHFDIDTTTDFMGYYSHLDDTGIEYTADLDGLRARDSFTAETIDTFNVSISQNGTTTNYTTNTGNININETGIVNVTVTAAEYFAKNYTNYNVSNILNAELHQAQLHVNVYDLIGNEITTGNITYTDGTYSATVPVGTTANLTADTFNITFSHADYYNKTIEYNTTAQVAETINISEVADSRINVTAYDIINSTYIQNFSINVTTDTTQKYNTTSGNILFPAAQNQTYNISIDATGYAIQSQLIDTDSQRDIDYQFLLPYTNSVNISIYDQVTGDIVTEYVEISFQGEESQTTYNTSTGQKFIHGLDPGSYNVLFTSENFSNSKYPITVSNRSFQSLDAYMLDSINEVVFTAKNKETREIVEDATVTVSRVISDRWTVVSVLTTDIAGQVKLTYSEDINYKIEVQADGYETKTFNLNPIIFNSYNIWLTATEATETPQDYKNIKISYEPNIWYDNANQNISFVFISSDGSLENYGYTVTFKGDSVSGAGTNAYGSELTNNLTIRNATLSDSVKVDYYYTPVGAATKTYHIEYPIEDVNTTNYTHFWNRGRTYGLGVLDRTLIVTIIVVILAGLSYVFSGILGAGLVVEFILGYFAYIQFLPIWAMITTMVAVGLLVVGSVK